MIQTTTSTSACDVVLSLDNADGTLTDISGSSNQVVITLTNLIDEWREELTRWPTRFLIGQDASIALTVLYTTTDDEGFDILRDWFASGVTGNDVRTIRIDIPDSSVGNDRWSGEVILESLDIPVSAGDGTPILVSASLQSSGAFGLTTIS